MTDKGSPPLTRELPRELPNAFRLSRITPAYAGTTAERFDLQGSHRDHPRLRGNYPANFPYSLIITGSPPLTRELLVSFMLNVFRSGITPAYAGTTIS